MAFSFKLARLPKIVFGSGAFASLADIIVPYGRKVLLITGGASLRDSGRLDSLLDSLAAHDMSARTATITGEPSPENVDSIVAQNKRHKIEVVVAIGGGSVIDAGKAVSAMLTTQGSVRDYLEGVGTKTPPGTKVPFVAVPTTSGTGSEATKNAVISIVGPQGFKKSLRHDNYVPDAAVVDPELTLSCPSQVTAACGMDAITQLIESYVSTNASPITDSLAERALKMALDNIVPVCTTSGHYLEARSALAYASLISGITLAHAGLGVVHGIASPMGAHFPAPHGAVCGTLLAPATRITTEKLRGDPIAHAEHLKKYAAIGAMIDQNSGHDVNTACDVLVTKLAEFADTLSLPWLGSWGVTKNDLATIAQESGCKNNPAPLETSEIIRILEDRL